MSDVFDRFGATVDIRGPEDHQIGTFLVRRKPNASRDSFDRVVQRLPVADNGLILSTPTIAVVVTTFGAAMGVSSHPAVAHVGGVRIDPQRLENLAHPER